MCDLPFRDENTVRRHHKTAHPERDASIDDDDMSRILLDSTSQPGDDTVAAPDDEAAVAMLTELESAEQEQPAVEVDQVRVGCNLCGNTYQLLCSLFKHVRDMHRANPRYHDVLKHVQDLRLRRMKRRNTLTCWLCGEQCVGQRLYKHIRVMHSDRSDYSELMKKARSIYKRSKPADSQAQCAHCQRSFAKSYLKIHFALCQRRGANSAYATRMRCQICNKQFASSKAHYEHRRTVHGLLADGKQALSFKCLACNRKFKSKDRLRTHMIRHTDAGKLNRYFFFCYFFRKRR